MNVLHPGAALQIGNALTSLNGWFKASLSAEGALFVHRLVASLSLWTSNSNSTEAGSIVMQGDGNLVALSRSGTPYWASNTEGNPNSALRIQDDGDLQILTPGGRVIWHSDSAQDLLSPTVQYQDAGAYSVNETSESWKQLCSALPCSLALQWPGYSTAIVEDRIQGNDVVIQLWKGWCPKFLGLTAFPGGIGAEVGIYRRIKGRLRPTTLPGLPTDFFTRMLGTLANSAEESIWWPYPELGTTLRFKLRHPESGELFMSAGAETTY